MITKPQCFSDTSADILSLCRQVQEKVKAQSGVELELEVKLLGEF